MPEVLRFGIHSLDELLGVSSDKSEGEAPFGIYLPRKEGIGRRQNGARREVFTTSVCIVGPNGTGKSIFALHMASKYLADCISELSAGAIKRLPAVVYVSTDFTFNMADRVWSKFALDYPFSRKDPFGPINTEPMPDPEPEINLERCDPSTLPEDFDLIEEQRGSVVFVDIASYTAGDDWGFLHKLLSLLPNPNDEDPRHLVIIDAIEGFEALAGELNAFGEKSTRRSRVAQVMRLLAGKCHALLVVEESKPYQRLAEEFVADTVMRLENIKTRNYERRVLQIEKARGQSHIRGQHHYSIRSGNGSTTGGQINPDDPEVLSRSTSKGNDRRQSYVQVFHSIHRLNRRIMEVRGKVRRTLKQNTYYAAFGITYLDNMLGGNAEITTRKQGDDVYKGYYFDTRGLPCRSTTALIGDSLTQKSILGKALLSRCFHLFDERLRRVHTLLNKADGDRGEVDRIWKLVRTKIQMFSSSSLAIDAAWETKGKALIKEKRWKELSRHLEDRFGVNQLPFPSSYSPKKELEFLLGGQTSAEEPHGEQLGILLDELRLTHLAAWLLDYHSGLAVMLVTHNTHYEQLAKEFICWLHSEVRLRELNSEMKGYEKALKNYIKGGTICRRLEIHNLSSEVLVHIIQQAIKSAQRRILTTEEMLSDETRYEKSWPIRVVIDDFSTFRDIFPELREDPLLLPSILFHFEREGLTTLIVDTQSGKPDTPIAERFESELRKLVQHNLYTWRVPFYGESRVAITAIPPFSYEYAGIVRELRWETESTDHLKSPSSNEPATVDPHFELYAGLEEGKPQSVPLRVQFYAETPALETYIDMENRFLNELFTPFAHPSQTNTQSVIVGVQGTNYNELRDFVYLTRDTRLDHALVFQVDEFWTMRPPSHRKRAGAFRPQRSYLNAITADAIQSKDSTPDPDVDPYRLFQLRESDRRAQASSGPIPDEPLRRRYFYRNYYEDFSDSEQFGDEENKDQLLIDRVPFTWDFGFLFCLENAWSTCGRYLSAAGEKPYRVRDVWDSLTKAKLDKRESKPIDYVSWRIFIEACKKAAEERSDRLSKPVTAFDFAQISPESFSCLILEVWFSEIYDSLNRKIKKAGSQPNKVKELEGRLDLLKTVSKRRLFTSVRDRKGEKPTLLLSKLLETYWLELYKSWLLLIEVLNFSDIVGEATALNFDFKSKNTDFSAIASRHWYKTASQCPVEVAAKEPLVAVRLPGRFSVRGDWFLAVSGGSRSIRQAERVLDLLNSRRANVSRLQLGIGLPTRFPDIETIEGLRTKLISHDEGHDNIEYKTFLEIGAHHASNQADEFNWLWRSSLSDYAHGNRIWHKWLNRMLLTWYRNLLRYKSVWRNSFEVYDKLTEDPPRLEKFAPEEPDLTRIDEKELSSTFKVESRAQLRVRRDFRKLWEVLRKELDQAAEADRNV